MRAVWEWTARLAAMGSVSSAFACAPSAPGPTALGAPNLPPEQAVSGPVTASPVVSFEPEASAAAVPPVVRARLRAPDPSTPLAPNLPIFWMPGETTSSQARLLVRGEASRAVLDSQIEWFGWFDEGPALVVAPALALPPLSTYTLIFGDTPTLMPIHVGADDGVPLARLAWPPVSEPTASRALAIYCAPAALPRFDCEARFDPGGVAGSIRSGVATPIEVARCLSWQRGPGASIDAATSDADAGVAPFSGPLMAPPLLRCGGGESEASVRLDPSPLRGDGSAPPAAPVPCAAAEIAVGLACIEAQDDRLVVRPPSVPVFWVVREAGGEARLRISDGSRFVQRVTRRSAGPSGAEPAAGGDVSTSAAITADAASVSIEVASIDLAGHTVYEARSLPLAPPRDHLVINELLANPLGPEPAQEWVELYNDGEGSVDLGQYRLAIGSAEPVALPSATLEPGAYALVVASSFTADDGVDAPPAAGTLIVRIARLGTSGLSNAGTAAALLDASGAVVSRFPARPATAGASIARIAPDALDDDEASFVSVATAGGISTPGASNGLAAEEGLVP